MPDTRYRPAYFVWDNQMGDDEKPCAPFRGFISDDPRDRHAYGETPYLEKAEVDRLIEQGPQVDPEELAWDDNGETLKVWVPTGWGEEATLRTIEPEYIKVCDQDILVWSVSLGWTWIEWEETVDMTDQARRMLHMDAREGTICRQCATDKGLDQGDLVAPTTDPEVLQAVDTWMKSGGLLYPRFDHGHACEQPGCTAKFVYCPDVGEQGYCDRLDTPIVCPSHDCRNYEPADIPADFKFRYADFGEYMVDGVRAPVDATRMTYLGRAWDTREF